MLTKEQSLKLKENCITIENYLKDLVKDYETNISLRAKFDNDHCSISVTKYGNNITVSGYSGGLSIIFDPNERKQGGSSTYAWEWENYGIDLCKNWIEIKNDLLYQLQDDKLDKQAIMGFKL